MRSLGHHDKYDKTINELRVRSHGGAAPRRVEITDFTTALTLNVEECRDLRYMLDQLIEGVDNDLRLRMRDSD